MASATGPPLHTELAYQPLSASSNEIRILVIDPAKSTRTELQCRLEHAPLAAGTDYTALSYCWGRTDGTVPVQIQGRVFLITPSLDGALRELRRRGCTRVWADAICINQDDSEERSQQVLRMAAIYRSASSVIAWLGDGDKQSIDSIFQLIHKTKALVKFNDPGDAHQQLGECRQHKDTLDTTTGLRDFETSDEVNIWELYLRRVLRGVQNGLEGKPTWVVEHPERGKQSESALALIRSHLQEYHWKALERLLSCEYWGRVWIIQELAMANQLEVLWGQHAFALLDLVYIIRAYKAMRKAGLTGTVISRSSRQHLENLLKFKTLQDRLEPVPLDTALRMSAFARSSDVRDKVYGLMGLTYDGAIIFPAPSYTRELWDINAEATLRLIRLKKSLDHMVFRSVRPGFWFIDWFNPKARWDERAESSIFQSSSTKWAATRSTRPRVGLVGSSATFDERRSQSKMPHGSSKKLWSGPSLVVDPADERGTAALIRCLFLSEKRMNRAIFDFLAGIKRALEQATAGIDPDPIVEWVTCSENRSFTINGLTLTQQLSQRLYPQTASWVDKLVLKNGQGYQKDHPATLAVLEAFKMGMRLGETTHGKVGWFTQYARPNDVVALVLGCSVPVVLRKLEDGTYMLVGDSIIDGIMQGEAMVGRDNDWRGWTEIELY